MKKNLRISFAQGAVKYPGIRYSPLRIAVRSKGTVGAENGIFPMRMKKSKMPSAQMSTGFPR